MWNVEVHRYFCQLQNYSQMGNGPCTSMLYPNWGGGVWELRRIAGTYWTEATQVLETFEENWRDNVLPLLQIGPQPSKIRVGHF